MQHGEKFNTLTHLLAAFIAFPSVVYLVFLAYETDDLWKIVSVSIYGVTLLMLYISSSLYHAHSGSLKKLLQKFDHLSIYLLIAGTYTPYMLVTLRGVWGWTILGVVWGLAIIGMLIDAFTKKDEKENKRIIPLIIYVLMGWLVVIPFKPLAENLASNGLTLLAIGGFLYTFGILFFVLDSRMKHAHGIWHLFVMGGSISHYVSITVYVI
jgi:hemolysin III